MGLPHLGQRYTKDSAPTPRVPSPLLTLSRKDSWLWVGLYWVIMKPRVPCAGDRKYQFFPSPFQPLMVRQCQRL